MRKPLLLAGWMAGISAALVTAPAPATTLPGAVRGGAAFALPSGGVARAMTLPAVAVAPGAAQTLAPVRAGPGALVFTALEAAPQTAPAVTMATTAASGVEETRSERLAAQGERQAATPAPANSGSGPGSAGKGAASSDSAPAATPAMPGPAADNTGRNKTHDSRVEAEDQSNAEGDVALVGKIRRALTADENLSMNAHNAKIIVSGNRVMLRGPVASAAERQQVEGIVRRQAAGRQIVNELEVAPR